MNDWQIRFARKQEKQWAQMAFQEVFSQVSLTNSTKLLPWYVSSTVPLPYMTKPLATTAWQEEDTPVTTTVCKLEGSQAPDPSDSPAHQTGTPPLPAPPFLDIPIVGTPLVGHPFAGFIASPHTEKVGLLFQQHSWWSMQQAGSCQFPRGRGKHSSTQGDENMLKLVPEARSSTKPQGQELTSPLSVQPRPPLILMMVLWWEPRGVPGIRTVRATPTIVGPHLTQTHPGRMWLTLI